MKSCNTCKVLKHLSEYTKAVKSKDGKQVNCKTCDNQLKAIWRLNNKDKIKAYGVEYYQKNKEQCAITSSNWKKNNKQKSVASSRRSQKKYPEKHCARQAQRKADKIKRTPKWLTKEDKKRILEFYKEANRLTIETGIQYEVDHILPLKGKLVSGFHHPDNLQILTKSENSSKNNKLNWSQNEISINRIV